MASDPMIDQTLGYVKRLSFVMTCTDHLSYLLPYHATNPGDNVPPSDPASNATGYQAAYDGEDFAMPYPAEAHRGPEDVQYISDVPTPIPSVAGSGSQPHGRMSEDAEDVQDVPEVPDVAPDVPTLHPVVASSSYQLPSMLSSNAAGNREASSRVETSPEPERPRRARARSKNDPKPALVGHVAPKNWKKQDGLRDSSPALKPSGLHYDSFAETQSKMSPPDWMPPADDVVPATDAELAPYVVRLVNAMKDMSKFKDNKIWIGYVGLVVVGVKRNAIPARRKHQLKAKAILAV
jgi:hypothetical protein